jgi:hypothetical protein
MLSLSATQKNSIGFQVQYVAVLRIIVSCFTVISNLANLAGRIGVGAYLGQSAPNPNCNHYGNKRVSI